MGKIADTLNKIWPWFQTTYDKIDKWDLPPNVKEALDEIWHLMEPSLQNSLVKFVQKVYEEYGPELGAKVLAEVIKILKKVLGEGE